MFETTLPRTRIELSLRGGCLNVFELDEYIGAAEERRRKRPARFRVSHYLPINSPRSLFIHSECTTYFLPLVAFRFFNVVEEKWRMASFRFHIRIHN